jgi:hypothetical protein
MSKPKNMTPEESLIWTAKNREWQRLNRLKHLEKFKERCREWGRKNRQKLDEANRKWRERNPQKASEYYNRWRKTNPERAKVKDSGPCETINDHYIAMLLGIPASSARKYPELLEAKREQIKILRELKPTTRTPKCTRIQRVLKKSETTYPKPPTPLGLTSLLSIELSSWSTPWVRQLAQLLLKSKRLN